MESLTGRIVIRIITSNAAIKETMAKVIIITKSDFYGFHSYGAALVRAAMILYEAEIRMESLLERLLLCVNILTYLERILKIGLGYYMLRDKN